MSWLKPSWLRFGTATLLVMLAILLIWPLWDAVPAREARPRPVARGDQEVVWLNAATSAVAWERFVTALRQVQGERGEAGLRLDDGNAFPLQTTAVPEVALYRQGEKSRLWIRWYKLAGDLQGDDWVEALTQRTPPPLAIIGGGSSDRARDLAVKLGETIPRAGAGCPLLFITTATADLVPLRDDPANWQRLDGLYAGRTFRFCFSNRQMARAVADFIWTQDDLRPDGEPVYLPAWTDDPYSLDLAEGFHDILGTERQRRLAAREVTRLWAWCAEFASGSATLPTLPSLACSAVVAPPAGPFWQIRIHHSIGGISHPNRCEADVAERMMTDRRQRPEQRRPLLVLPATVQPARRFLRGLMRIAPLEASRFVVASGDTPDFNTVFRDRYQAWPIQDLPYDLVFFCHRNPLDPAALSTESEFTGQEDLRLYADIGRALTDAAWGDQGLVGSASELATRLRLLPKPKFDENGNWPSGEGEFVVCLRPTWDFDRVRPRARLQVFRAEGEGHSRWNLVHEFDLGYRENRLSGELDVPGGGPP